MFAFQDKRSAVEVAFTDRFGGRSAGPYAELTLTVPTDPGAVEQSVDENWDLVSHAMMRGGPPDGDNPFELPPGTPSVTRVFSMRQVHGARVLVVDGETPPNGSEADAAVTATPGVILAARAADCIPVLLADPDRNVVGGAHAGRVGVLAGVVPSAVAALRDLGAERLVAWIGPAACGRCYEVPATMREEVGAVLPETWSETSWGTPALDLVAGVQAQLRAAGVQEVVDLKRCTIEDADFYSHRRQHGVAGRHAGLVWVRP
ncbi:MAG: purine-nucleoside/S-methyl-5-thioadenosine phosphorylase / adenosine deaminase [Nocardioidaceae bacterium]|nr:purine-nucleoside/S-methyl-5-thioadenosine phosphorylase / adenosine deaminase [Nocardioidaceae bacterium]